MEDEKKPINNIDFPIAPSKLPEDVKVPKPGRRVMFVDMNDGKLTVMDSAGTTREATMEDLFSLACALGGLASNVRIG